MIIKSDAMVREQLLICPIGYTKGYKSVNYQLNNESTTDWLSSQALLKLKGSEIKDYHIIIIYPNNEGANQSIEKGWPDDGIPAIDSIFSEAKSYDKILVNDDSILGENEISSLMVKLNDKILSFANNEELDIIFDLTHSYRHLSLAAFIQALFLTDFNEKISIKDVYYALAKQPLKNNDPVYYVQLNGYMELISDIGSIQSAIDELRPKKISDIGTKYEKLAKKTESDEFWKWMGKLLKDLAEEIMLMQKGFCTAENFSNLSEIVERKFTGEKANHEFASKLIVDNVIIKVKNLLSKFMENNELVPFYQRQIVLAEHSINNQYDLLKAYAFMREAFVSYCLSHLFPEYQESGTKEQRENVERKLGKSHEEIKSIKSEELRTITNLFQDFGNKRNSLAHVGTGRRSNNEANLNKSVKNALKDLKKLNKFIQNTDKDLIIKLLDN